MEAAVRLCTGWTEADLAYVLAACKVIAVATWPGLLLAAFLKQALCRFLGHDVSTFRLIPLAVSDLTAVMVMFLGLSGVLGGRFLLSPAIGALLVLFLWILPTMWGTTDPTAPAGQRLLVGLSCLGLFPLSGTLSLVAFWILQRA